MSLPSELLYQVFDCLDGGPRYLLRHPARVCSQWRSVVRRHPRFNSQISIGQYAPNWIRGQGTWVYQLQASHEYNTPFHLTVLFAPPSIASMPHVADHMHRCLSLTLENVAINLALHDFMQTLRVCSAPILQHLAISLRPANRWEVPGGEIPTEIIPLDLFSGHAPLLRRLRLDPQAGELFPLSDVPAFAQIRRLELDSGPTGSSDFTGLFPSLAAFRGLHTLAIWGQHFLPPLDVDYGLPALPQLNSLSLSRLPNDWVHQIHALDVSRFSEIVQDVYSAEQGRPYLTVFRRCLVGPLHLAVEQCLDPERNAPSFRISVRSLDAARTLRFCGRPYNTKTLLFNPASINTTSLELEGLAASIVRLDISCCFARAVTHFLSFSLPAVTTLAVSIESAECLPRATWGVTADGKGPLDCPSLREVILKLQDATRWRRFPVACDDAARFLQGMIGPPTAVVQRALRVVAPLVLTGECAGLAETVGISAQS